MTLYTKRGWRYEQTTLSEQYAWGRDGLMAVAAFRYCLGRVGSGKQTMEGQDMTDNTHPEALRLADMLTADEWPGRVTLVSYARECVAELRRQHARITELEAQLEAIGAGGVNGPLMGRAVDHFPDVTKMVSRWYVLNKDGMATLCADQADAEQGVKEAQTLWPHMGPHRVVQLVDAGHASAAANAGSEPVAWRIDWPDEPELGHYFSEAPTDSGRCQPLYLHPYPPEGMAGWKLVPIEPTPAMLAAVVTSMDDFLLGKEAEKQYREDWAAMLAAAPTAQAEGWVSVDERLPEPDGPVLAHNGKWTGVAAWMSGEYLEPLERWQDEHREFVEMMGPAITHWMPLPASPTIEGESNGK